MIIDYVTLMLTNIVAAFVVLAAFVTRVESDAEQNWASVFLIIGIVATVSGFAMSFTWPLPGPYNTMFGEPSILLGVLFIGASFSLVRRFDLSVLGYYAAVAGIVAIVLGVRIMLLKLTLTPILTGIGFIFSGICGIAVRPYFALRKNRSVRFSAVIVLTVPAVIWLRIALFAYWNHLATFGKG